jgi:putative membrane protein
MNPWVFCWTLVFGSVLIWSGIDPKDQLTWFLEVSPGIVGGLVLLATYRRFPLTPLLYTLILAHCVILFVGGHYTYAEVPLFDGLFGMERNNYDKLGHFFQGLVPALIAREILVRSKVVRGGWLVLFVVSIALAFSAFYEMIEWWVALLSDEAADAFLGAQGYVWDTQSDMFMALVGAICAVVFLSRWHDVQLSQFPACR